MRPFVAAVVVVLGASLVAGACVGDGGGGGSDPAAGRSPASTLVTTASTSQAITETTSTMVATVPGEPPTSAPAPRPTPTTTSSAPPSGPVTIAYRLERRTTDEATADFEAVAEATLTDPRGWTRAAFVFERREDAPYLVVLAEGDEVDRLCLPYDTYGKYSCQNGPVVALNADRWRAATPKWTGDLADYRRMLVNHEVGHLLGMRHPKPQCARPGEPAPIMNQQSTELNGCLPNPWPRDDEIAVASRHDRKLAPAHGE